MKLMTHIVAGYPNLKESEKIVMAMSKSRVSFIEIQMPFSDPIADGPTITNANKIALENGITTKKCFEFIKNIKKKVKIPILIMSYFNIVLSHGVEKFCKKAQESGVYGLIIPDIPLDEEKFEHYIHFCKKHKLHPIQVISPITTEERLNKIAKVASGFVYCISSFGTTGARNKLNIDLSQYLEKVKRHIHIPLAVGFGISNRQQVESIKNKADIAVIGSEIINIYNENKNKKIAKITDFIQQLSI